MKKIIVLISIVFVVVLSGCVNSSFLKSAQAYYDSTLPYMNVALEDKTISQAEVDSLRMNMEQFKKTLDHYSANKAWYEF